MRRRRRLATRFVPLVFLGLCALLWQFGPFEAVRSVASLSDPAKLQTLGERGANARLNKIVYWIHHARQRGLGPEQTVTWSQWLHGSSDQHRRLVKESLLRNLKIADELGLLTPENLEQLRRGQAAVVRLGPYEGERVEIDHIVPFSLAPEVGNELANLEMLPQTLNRRKSDQVGDRQIAHAEKLSAAGLLRPDSYQRLQAAARPKSARGR